MNIRCVLVVILCIAWPAMAETIDAGPFSVDVTPKLTVRCNDVVLFSGDRCDVLRRGLNQNDPSPVGTTEDGELLHDGNVLTLLARQGRNTLRREVMVTPEAVHITYELRVFGSTGGTHMMTRLAPRSRWRVSSSLLRWRPVASMMMSTPLPSLAVETI